MSAKHAPGIDLTDEMVVAAMDQVPGCDHDDMVDALERALQLTSPVYHAAPDMLKALRALVIESGGRAIPNSSLTACRNHALAVIAQAETRDAPMCPYCGTWTDLRMIHDGCGGFFEPEYICEDCFMPQDDGPSFDDLPKVMVETPL